MGKISDYQGLFQREGQNYSEIIFDRLYTEGGNTYNAFAYSANASNGSANMILIRYADVLLMYAEAKVELGELDQSVYDALNEIRSRPTVEMPPIEGPYSQNELREIVRNERVVELGFEGLRLYDMNRWRIGEEKEGEVLGSHFRDSDGNWYLQSIGFTRSFNPNRYYLWPIPISEINSNSAITQNNPGYN